MAKHYYANQFDIPYRPTYLRNWEVPKYFCPKPRSRIGHTYIISNSRGHLLPGAHRPPCNPFGDYQGTWELPKKITRAVANELNGSAGKVAFLEKCRRFASAPPLRAVQIPPEPPSKVQCLKGADAEIDLDRVICPIHDF